jgi:quinol monooxygenase YgiN
MTYVIGWVTLKAGKREEFMRLAEPVLAVTKKEKGCLFYEFHPSASDPDLIVVIEGWESAADHLAHQKALHHVAFGAEVVRLALKGRFEEIEAARVERPSFVS